MSRILPDDDKRGQYPLYSGLMAFFPAALLAVSKWSHDGGAKHRGDNPLRWVREVSTDHEDKIMRHLLDARVLDKNGFPADAAALAWRALALLQTILEEQGWAEGANAKRQPDEEAK